LAGTVGAGAAAGAGLFDRVVRVAAGFFLVVVAAGRLRAGVAFVLGLAARVVFLVGFRAVVFLVGLRAAAVFFLAVRETAFFVVRRLAAVGRAFAALPAFLGTVRFAAADRAFAGFFFAVRFFDEAERAFFIG
jgi:hypothetical protein